MKISISREMPSALPNAPPSGRCCSIFGMLVDEINYESVLVQVCQWTAASSSRYVCISNVHMVMESYDDTGFQEIVNGADLVVADGVPVFWASRWLGLTKQELVLGLELTIRLCEMAAREGIPVGFYGSTPDVVAVIQKCVIDRFPTLKVPFCISPPFRPLTAEEDERTVHEINQSGVRILFVGLGCPKQERWMSEHRGRVFATMLGVGWAFEVLGGKSKMAPVWIQRIGMQWFYRLILNPRKLWRRYLKHNPRFVVLILWELLSKRRGHSVLLRRDR
jgi:N-acetylglucosaminyldiphosphoundecaprenol N-acetyl-beta-D-mannosaminyltransferase